MAEQLTNAIYEQETLLLQWGRATRFVGENPVK